jgi:hypothetical protein
MVLGEFLVYSSVRNRVRRAPLLTEPGKCVALQIYVYIAPPGVAQTRSKN